MKAYGSVCRTAPATAVNADVWTYIRSRQRKYFDTLESKDPERLAAYLCNMSRHDATHGTVQGDWEYKKLLLSPRYRRYISLMAKDKLVLLAEALGAVPVENPEQGEWGMALRRDSDNLVATIENKLGRVLRPPAIDGGLFKLETARGEFSERDCNAIYTAWLLTEQLTGGARPSVCEIGGGVGRVAYWSMQFGAGNYMIADLPHINVLQGFYLMKAMPQLRVCLYGEDARDADVVIWPGDRLAEAPRVAFDLVLNQDSFPEIHADIVRNYLRWIRTVSPRFISINHESRPNSIGDERQVSVPELVSDVGGFERKARWPYWLRRGYVLEDYATGGIAPGPDIVA